MFNFLKPKKAADASDKVIDKVTDEATQKPLKWTQRLRHGLKKTRHALTDRLGSLLLGKKIIDAKLFEEIESILLLSDVGIDATSRIINQLTQQVARKELSNPEVLIATLKELLQQLLVPQAQPIQINSKPFIILVVGVNGTGKTTSIAKMSHYYQQTGMKVMLAAGDTFRAAAIDQLQTWGERNNMPVIAQHPGADSASVIYDAVQAAKARDIDILIADTAGRLHTQENLMSELQKIKRIMGKLDPKAPHEVLLVLDAGTGQNALQQAQQFHESIGLTGLVITKLDGTAKGGVIFAICEKMKLPIRFIGVGEQVDDLKPFDAKEFVDTLFEEAT